MIAPYNNINICVFTFIKNRAVKNTSFFTARIFIGFCRGVCPLGNRKKGSEWVNRTRKLTSPVLRVDFISVRQEEHCKEEQGDDPSACFYLFDFAGEKFDNNV